jgi:hypothetical protein
LDDLFEQPAESDCCALFSTAVSLSNFLSIRLGILYQLRACRFIMEPVFQKEPAVLIAGEF